MSHLSCTVASLFGLLSDEQRLWGLDVRRFARCSAADRVGSGKATECRPTKQSNPRGSLVAAMTQRIHAVAPLDSPCQRALLGSCCESARQTPLFPSFLTSVSPALACPLSPRREGIQKDYFSDPYWATRHRSVSVRGLLFIYRTNINPRFITVTPIR